MILVGRRGGMGCVGAALWVFAAPPARAAPAIAVSSEGEAACPPPVEVAAKVAELVPGADVSAEPRPGAVDARIDDLGDRFRVRVLGVEREVLDAARNCRERAQTAAVLIALIVDPPWVAGAPPAPPIAPPAVVAARPAPPRRRAQVTLELAGSFGGAPRTAPDSGISAYGGRLELQAGGRWLGGALGIAALAPATVQLQGGAVQLGHVPIDLDARFALRRGRLELAGEVGVGLLVVDVRGQGFFTDQHSVGIEWGVRGAASLRVWLRDRVAPVLGVSLLGVPAPVEFVVARGGVVGSDPKLWLDVSLGLAVRLQ